MPERRIAPFALIALIALLWAGPAAAGPLEDSLLPLQEDWAVATYKTPKSQKEAAFKALADRAHALSAAHPDRAEPKVWEAIILSGYADALGGLDSLFNALPKVKTARALLLAAERIQPTVLDGAVYTSLGSLHYMVPGWPVAFGDQKKAEAYLKKALAIAPHDMDANYFMGDFLLRAKRYPEAARYLAQAVSAPARPGRPVADAGRRAEAQARLAETRSHIR